MLQELPPVGEIFQKMQDHWKTIQDYTVTAKIIVDIPGIRMPRMKAKIYFKKPNRYHFETKGFALLPKEGLGVPPARLEKWKKDAQLAGTDTLNGEPVFHLLVEPHHSGTPLFQIHLYVDQKSFILKKLQTQHPTGSTMQIKFHYKKLKPDIWLPNKIISHFEIKATRLDSMAEKFRPKVMNGENIFKSPFKKGTVYVYLKNYKLNTGLSDAIFKKENQNSKRSSRKTRKQH